MQTLETESGSSQKERLLHFLKHMGLFSSHAAVSWGSQNGCDEAKRRLRELVSEGKIRRLDDIEIELKQLRKPGAARLGWYEFVSM